METQEEKTEAFLAHFGVKGMKWGQIKARRVENVAARNKTRAAVRQIQAKPIGKDEASIKKARAQESAAYVKYRNAKDQYKLDKLTQNRIDAKRPMKIAAAELTRIQNQADVLTPKEQSMYDAMQFGRNVADILMREPRDPIQKIADSQNDHRRARSS